MNEVFRERVVESPETPEIEPQHVPTADEVVGSPDPNIKPLKDTESLIENIEVWEGENKRKYGHDYFDIREIADTFPLKAQFGYIDKYVKQELENRGYEKTTKNYEAILQEIEAEIGSSRLDAYKRMQKIFSYLQVVKKISDLKKKKQLYMESFAGGKSS